MDVTKTQAAIVMQQAVVAAVREAEKLIAAAQRLSMTELPSQLLKTAAACNQALVKISEVPK